MSTIRLLLLGTLLQRPLHGYELRRELEQWDAGRWANIAYGSIYFGLSKMAEEELVELIEVSSVANRPARSVYAITSAGRREFERLLREHWWEVKPSLEPFLAALAFMPYLRRDDLLAALHRRASLLRSGREELAQAGQAKLSQPGTPRHVAEITRLMGARVEAELHWLEQVTDRVERGELP